jgi:hypothetical protein
LSIARTELSRGSSDQPAARRDDVDIPLVVNSVHYLILSRPAKAIHVTELQVRTVFEEGWSEIDHQVRYPRVNDDPLLAQFITIFNRLAGSADEMGSFLKILSVHLAEQETRRAEFEQRLSSKEEALNKAIGQLAISQKEKEDLGNKVDELRRQTPKVLTFDTSSSLASLYGKNALEVKAPPLALGASATVFTNRACPNCSKVLPSLIFQGRCPFCGVAL